MAKDFQGGSFLVAANASENLMVGRWMSFFGWPIFRGFCCWFQGVHFFVVGKKDIQKSKICLEWRFQRFVGWWFIFLVGRPIWAYVQGTNCSYSLAIRKWLKLKGLRWNKQNWGMPEGLSFFWNTGCRMSKTTITKYHDIASTNVIVINFSKWMWGPFFGCPIIFQIQHFFHMRVAAWL